MTILCEGSASRSWANRVTRSGLGLNRVPAPPGPHGQGGGQDQEESVAFHNPFPLKHSNLHLRIASMLQQLHPLVQQSVEISFEVERSGNGNGLVAMICDNDDAVAVGAGG